MNKNYLTSLLRIPAWCLLLALPLTGQENPPADNPPPPAPAEETAAATPAETPPAVSADAPESYDPQLAPAEPEPAAKPAKAGKKTSAGKRVRVGVAKASHSRPGNELVAIFHDVHLERGRQANVVVAILGSARSDGEVADSVVSVFGNTRVAGPVGDSVVAVLGNTYVDSPVGGDVVAVMGNVELGPNAVVGGDVTTVGGKLIKQSGAVIGGGVHEVAIMGGAVQLDWLHTWIKECLLYGRPLAFNGNVAWAWVVAGAFFAFYVLLALLFPQALKHCAETLEQKPGFSLLAMLLTVLGTPVLILLLVLTGVGIIFVPFVGTGLLLAAFFGKAVMHAWIGRRLLGRFGNGGAAQMALATLVGGIVVLLLYTVPVLGALVWKFLPTLGLGVVVYTVILHIRRNRPVPPPIRATAATAGGAAWTPPLPVEGAHGEVVPPAEFALVPAALPRAGFWIRAAALGLDLLLVGLVTMMASHLVPAGVRFSAGPGIILLLAAYGAVLWKHKGTTIGGIICGLKVVRLDDRPIDWMTAIVRALACFLSLAPVGLGFIWVAFDDQRQSWHDKIAGTTVVRVPKGVSLI